MTRFDENYFVSSVVVDMGSSGNQTQTIQNNFSELVN